MKERNYNIVKFIALLAVVLISSCASRRDVIYLQDAASNSKEESRFVSPKFKVDDRLTITVSSINPEAARPYNLFLASFNTGNLSGNGQQQQQSYLVDANGEIGFPQLGKIKVLGKSRIELEEYLEEELERFLPDAKVNVQLVNFRISILGEVRTPGEYIINRDKITILQAVSLAGDLTIHGKRDNVLLIREINGKIKKHRIDLRSENVISSDSYYLQQNDVIYVSPNKPRVNASASSPTASYIISATGLLITVVSLLTR